LQGAEHAFKIVSEYNRDNPEADLRVYSTFLDYLKHEELKEPMEKLIDKYNIKFYETPEDMVEWKDWKLLIGNNEYYTPYADKEEWKSTMEEREKKDSARIIQKNLEKFSGGVYDDIRKILSEENPLGDFLDPVPLADKVIENIMNNNKEVKNGQPSGYKN
jgi:hypothetical protein